jgi:IclR family KDG regulon transcriptional repressor
LEEINQKTKLSSYLGIRSDAWAVIIDKVDTAFEIKIYSEIGMRLPLLAGAAGKALLAQLSEAELDDLLSENKLKKHTPNACTNKNTYKKSIKKVRDEGVAVDREEYIEGIRAIAVPLYINRNGIQAAIWAVGLKRQIKEELIAKYSRYLVQITHEIEAKLESN